MVLGREREMEGAAGVKIWSRKRASANTYEKAIMVVEGPP